MKRVLLQAIALMTIVATSAQTTTYGAENSWERKEIVSYNQSSDGFYRMQTNVEVDEVKDIINTYAYDKKNKKLYVTTHRSNCEIVLKDDAAKRIKKDKNIRQLKAEEIPALIEKENFRLAERYKDYNANRQKQVNDSIAKAKAKADLLAKVRRDSIERVKRAQLMENYRKSHNWRWLPVGQHWLTCDYCSDNIPRKDSILIMSLTNDTIYFAEQKEGDLYESYYKFHAVPVSSELKKNDKYQYHVTAFQDSLRAHEIHASKEVIDDLNYENIIKYFAEITKAAPYGYVYSWGWDKKYSEVTMNLTYFNTNKKTIKYIDVHFRIYNDVGDVRKTGVFKGTGPVEQLHSGSWNWDSSHYYVSGDASNMSITQIVLTYMDGTKKTLSKNQIVFN